MRTAWSGPGPAGKQRFVASTYILECADGSFYTGSTVELEQRMQEHAGGVGARFTAKRLPVKLVYSEWYDRVEDAYAREKQIQGWRREKKQALIAGQMDRLHELAKNRDAANS